MFRKLLITSGFALAAAGLLPERALGASIGDELPLNGAWDTGIDRKYDSTSLVPGLAGDLADAPDTVLWYRRTVVLPEGDWTTAVLQLNGARFAPVVYVDGYKIGESSGGMVPLRLSLRGAGVVPGGKITLEIALKTLSAVAASNGADLPQAYRDRADLAPGLWDSATLHFCGDAQISRIVAATDFTQRRVFARWAIEGSGGITVDAAIVDRAGKTLVTAPTAGAALMGSSELDFRHACKPWTLADPRTYRIRLVLRQGERVEDVREINWAVREFKNDGSRYWLNGESLRLRGGSIDWNTWLSEPQARAVAFDPAWFDANVVRRLKSLGANFVRFRLGLPPESFLDLCDREGLLVQVEWPFSNGGMTPPDSFQEASGEGQEAALRHPSVVLIEPWNETQDDELPTARAAETARRLRATGAAPIVIASNPDDREAWNAFAAALSPLSVSLDVGDQSYARGKTIALPVVFLNDTDRDRSLNASVRVVAEDEGGETLFERTVRQSVPAHDRRIVDVPVKIPDESGAWRFEAQLNTPVPGVTEPVVSSRHFRTSPEAGTYSFVH